MGVVVAHQQRIVACGLYELLQRVELLVVELDPGDAVLEEHSAGGHLQALAVLGRRDQGLDFMRADHGEELALHLPVLDLGGRRQVDLDHVDDRVLQIEPVLGVQRQTDVRQPGVDVIGRVLGCAPLVELAVAGLHRAEPPLAER